MEARRTGSINQNITKDFNTKLKLIKQLKKEKVKDKQLKKREKMHNIELNELFKTSVGMEHGVY